MEGVMIYGDNVLNSANEALRLAPKDVEYIELQYHGQLSFDSVTEIMFQYNEKPSDEIIKKLKDKGIKVYIKEKMVAHEI